MFDKRVLVSIFYLLFGEQVIAEHLSAEEVAGIKEGFKLMDINNNGKINLEELRIGLHKLGHQIPEADARILMEAVSDTLYFLTCNSILSSRNF